MFTMAALSVLSSTPRHVIEGIDAIYLLNFKADPPDQSG
jgi:hypothetical protein